jgi:hypothetical protein
MVKKTGYLDGRGGMSNQFQGRGRGSFARGRGGRGQLTPGNSGFPRSAPEVSPPESRKPPSINNRSSAKHDFFSPRVAQSRPVSNTQNILDGNPFAALSDTESATDTAPTTPSRPTPNSNRSPLPSPAKPSAKRQKSSVAQPTSPASLPVPPALSNDEECFHELDRQVQEDINECTKSNIAATETKEEEIDDEELPTDASEMQTDEDSDGTEMDIEVEETEADSQAIAAAQEEVRQVHIRQLKQWKQAKIEQDRAKLAKRVHKTRVENISSAMELNESDINTDDADSHDGKSDDACSDSTPVQRNAARRADQAVEGLTRRCFGNGIPRRQHLWRYDLKLRIPPSTTPDKAVIQVTTAWFTKTIEYDTHAAVVPFYDSDETTSRRAIANPAKIPQGMGEFKKYFARAAPKVEGGDNYMSIALATDKPYDEIISDMGWWYKQHGHSLYKRGIQTERTKNIGWILYSTRAMDSKFMRDMFQKLVREWDVGKKQGLSLPISVRWKMIPRTERGPIPENEVSRALCLETAFDDADIIKMCMESFYDYKCEVFPGGIKLRFVPDKAYLTGFEDMTGFTNLRARQQRFTENILEFTTFEIASLHHPFKDMHGITKSLRARIMDITPKDRPYMSLFLYVDTAFQGDRIVFNFLPQVSSEATTTIAGLVPRMRYLCGDKCAKCFTTYAWDRHSESTWNPETHEVDSPDSQRITGLQEIDPEFMFEVVNMEDVSKSADAAQRPDPTNPQRAFPEFEATPDDESCRTFGRPHTQNGTSIPKSDAPSKVSAMSSGTNSSFVTLEDFEKRLATLDKLNQERSEKNETMLQAILDKLANSSNQFNPSPGNGPEQPSTTSEGENAAAQEGCGEFS